MLDLLVEDLGAQGDGIARHRGDKVFVPLAIPGDHVRVELRRETTDGISSRLVEILHASPERRESPCLHFNAPDLCGGCAMQQLDPSAYSLWKTEQVRAALRHQGLDRVTVEPLRTTQPGTRRRATFAAAKRSSRVVIGFNQRHSHRIVALHDCLVLEPAIARLVAQLRAMLALVMSEGETADISVTLLSGELDVLLTYDRPLTLAAREALASFAEQQDVARLSWRRRERADIEPLAWRRPVSADFGGVRVPVAPGAFLQATAEGERALVDAVLEGVGAARQVIDLFAGSGTFSFPLANGASRRVHAVEGDSAAVHALTAAARQFRLPVTAECRDLFRNPLSPAELAGFEAAIFDPPRAGARAQAEMLASSGLETVIGVSCNPATFARDARVLVDGGFELERVLPVDQFLWTAHTEIVGNFTRLK